MPITQTNVDISSKIGTPNISGTKIKDTNYTGIWAVANGSKWIVQYTTPGGTILDKDIASAYPSPLQEDIAYRLYYGSNEILDTLGNPVDTHYLKSDFKIHCGRPN